MAGQGTGQLLYFRCSACRRSYRDVRLTGRSRSKQDGKARGRSSNRIREYTCRCGHTGWSRHVDLERLEQQAGATPGKDSV